MLQGVGVEKKGRFAVIFRKQSQHWAKGRVKMESFEGFELELPKGDVLMS